MQMHQVLKSESPLNQPFHLHPVSESDEGKVPSYPSKRGPLTTSLTTDTSQEEPSASSQSR